MIAAMIVYHTKISEINYWLSLIIMVASSEKGALFPDLDLHWSNIPNKTFIKKVINTIICRTGGRHRSWQTHSWDICIGSLIASTLVFKYMRGAGENVSLEVGYMIVLGFIAGWVSHLVTDMFTSKGVRVFCTSKKTVKFVPKKVGSLYFNTGNEWEDFAYKIISFVSAVVSISALAVPIVESGVAKKVLGLVVR